MEREIELQPIPEMEHYICQTCGTTTVSQVGNQVLCQNCVNTFLARNVGLMAPLSEIQAQQAALETEEAKNKKKRPAKKKATRKKVQEAGTG